MISLVEVLLDSEKLLKVSRISHFTSLEGAASSLLADKFRTSPASRSTDVQDLNGWPFYMSVTFDTTFEAGFVQNINDQGNKDKLIEVQYVLDTDRLVNYLKNLKKDVQALDADFFRNYQGRGALAQTDQLDEREIKLGTNLVTFPKFFSSCLVEVNIEGANDPETTTYGLAKSRKVWLKSIEKACRSLSVPLHVRGRLDRLCGYKSKSGIQTVGDWESRNTINSEFNLSEIKIDQIAEIAAICLWNPKKHPGSYRCNKFIQHCLTPSGISDKDLKLVQLKTQEYLQDPNKLFEKK